MNSCGRKIFFWATYLNAVWIINEWNGAETLTLQITFWYPFATEFVAFWYLWDNDKFSKQVDNVNNIILLICEKSSELQNLFYTIIRIILEISFSLLLVRYVLAISWNWLIHIIAQEWSHYNVLSGSEHNGSV